MTKQNRQHLLIATLVSGGIPTIANAAIAPHICALPELLNNGGLEDYCPNISSGEDAYLSACCESLYEENLTERQDCYIQLNVQGGTLSQDCSSWSDDDNPSGSDGYIGGSGTPTPSWNCANGYYHEEGGSGCTECPPYTDYDGYDFTIYSSNGRDEIIDCFVPAGKISHTFTDKNNNKYTISIDDNCSYKE